MTALTKPVRRKVSLGGRPVVVTLYPSGVVGVRELRRRREHLVPLGRVYRLAVEVTVEAERKEREAARARARAERGLPPVRRLVRRGLLRP